MNKLLLLLVVCVLAGCATAPSDLPPDKSSASRPSPPSMPPSMPSRY